MYTYCKMSGDMFSSKYFGRCKGGQADMYIPLCVSEDGLAS